MYSHSQALRLFRAHGVRVPVALSPSALAYIAKHPLPRSVAGLAELSAVSNPSHRRGMFETLVAFQARELALRSHVHAQGLPRLATVRSFVTA